MFDIVAYCLKNYNTFTSNKPEGQITPSFYGRQWTTHAETEMPPLSLYVKECSYVLFPKGKAMCSIVSNRQ